MQTDKNIRLKGRGGELSTGPDFAAKIMSVDTVVA